MGDLTPPRDPDDPPSPPQAPQQQQQPVGSAPILTRAQPIDTNAQGADTSRSTWELFRVDPALVLEAQQRAQASSSSNLDGEPFELLALVALATVTVYATDHGEADEPREGTDSRAPEHSREDLADPTRQQAVDMLERSQDAGESTASSERSSKQYAPRN